MTVTGRTGLFLLPLFLFLREVTAGCVFDISPAAIRCDLRILDFRRNSSEVAKLFNLHKLQIYCNN
jgi:hypothetical protein